MRRGFGSLRVVLLRLLAGAGNQSYFWIRRRINLKIPWHQSAFLFSFLERGRVYREICLDAGSYGSSVFNVSATDSGVEQAPRYVDWIRR